MKFAVKLSLLLLGLALVSASVQVCPSSDSGMPGGWTPINVTDSANYEEMLLYVEDAIANITANVTLPCDEPQIKVLDACSQVVAGTNYRVVYELSCLDGDDVEIAAAQIYVPLEGPIKVEPIDLDADMVMPDGEDMPDMEMDEEGK